jgi:hypothetical protein
MATAMTMVMMTMVLNAAWSGLFMKFLRRKYPDIIPGHSPEFIDLGQHLANTALTNSACHLLFILSFQAFGSSRMMK